MRLNLYAPTSGGKVSESPKAVARQPRLQRNSTYENPNKKTHVLTRQPSPVARKPPPARNKPPPCMRHFSARDYAPHLATPRAPRRVRFSERPSSKVPMPPSGSKRGRKGVERRRKGVERGRFLQSPDSTQPTAEKQRTQQMSRLAAPGRFFPGRPTPRPHPPPLASQPRSRYYFRPSRPRAGVFSFAPERSYRGTRRCRSTPA